MPQPINKNNMTLLKNHISKPEFSLEDIFEKEVHIYSKTIDCNALNMPNYSLKFDEYEVQLNTIINDLKAYNAPCLYWFSAQNHETALKLMEQLNQFREVKSKRTLPAKNNNKNSNIIYVGKRNAGIRNRDNLTNIAGRIAIHFGYYEVDTTQGLQLAYWAKEQLTLNVMVLPIESADYLVILEKLLAKKLNPLCGRH